MKVITKILFALSVATICNANLEYGLTYDLTNGFEIKYADFDCDIFVYRTFNGTTDLIFAADDSFV
jgi:hypothetical protein